MRTTRTNTAGPAGLEPCVSPKAEVKGCHEPVVSAQIDLVARVAILAHEIKFLDNPYLCLWTNVVSCKTTNLVHLTYAPQHVTVTQHHN